MAERDNRAARFPITFPSLWFISAFCTSLIFVLLFLCLFSSFVLLCLHQCVLFSRSAGAGVRLGGGHTLGEGRAGQSCQGCGSLRQESHCCFHTLSPCSVILRNCTHSSFVSIFAVLSSVCMTSAIASSATFRHEKRYQEYIAMPLFSCLTVL